MKSKVVERLDKLGFEFALYSEDQRFFYTFDLKIHHEPEKGHAYPTTIIPFAQKEVLIELGNCLIELGIMKDHASTKELSATRFHLEDMRKIAFHEIASVTMTIRENKS